jgi:hypothetical protein
MVDSYNSRRFPMFHLKIRADLTQFTSTLCDGGLLIAEAGRESEKSKGKALVKAEAARRLAQIKAGAYWIGTVRRVGVHGIPTTGRKG